MSFEKFSKKEKEYLKQRESIITPLLDNYDLKGYIEFLKKEIVDDEVSYKIKIRNIEQLAKINDESVLKFLDNYLKSLDTKKMNEKIKNLLKFKIEETLREIKRNIYNY